MSANGTALPGIDEAKLAAWSEKYGLDARQMKSLAQQLLRVKSTRPAAIQFLFLLANAIARLCYQEFQLRQRVNELTAVYSVTMMLADARDLQKVLQRTVELVAEVMQTKAASIRLIDRDHDELVIKAVHNLSAQYLAKGPIRLSKAVIDQVALSLQGFLANQEFLCGRRRRQDLPLGVGDNRFDIRDGRERILDLLQGGQIHKIRES